MKADATRLIGITVNPGGEGGPVDEDMKSLSITYPHMHTKSLAIYTLLATIIASYIQIRPHNRENKI